MRLGLRLYFIAVLARDSGQPFDLDGLHHQLRRAERLLASANATSAEPPRDDCLARLAGSKGWVARTA